MNFLSIMTVLFFFASLISLFKSLIEIISVFFTALIQRSDLFVKLLRKINYARSIKIYFSNLAITPLILMKKNVYKIYYITNKGVNIEKEIQMNKQHSNISDMSSWPLRGFDDFSADSICR